MGRRARTKEDAINRCLSFFENQNQTCPNTSIKQPFKNFTPEVKIQLIRKHLKNNPRICKLIATFSTENSECGQETVDIATGIILTHMLSS